MKTVATFFRFLFKLTIFVFVFGVLILAILEYYGKSPSELWAEYRQQSTASVSTFSDLSNPSIDRDFMIPIEFHGNIKWLDTRTISNVESWESKDVRFHLCLDAMCEETGDLLVKRMSLATVFAKLSDRDISCFYKLKKDIINFNFLEKVDSYPSQTSNYHYKYEAVMYNEFQINIPDGRKTEFDGERSSCGI